MSDRREEILWLQPHPTMDSVTINGAKDAMDEYMRQTCLGLLEYMAKNKVVCGTYSDGDEAEYYFKGEWISKEQLFENFL